MAITPFLQYSPHVRRRYNLRNYVSLVSKNGNYELCSSVGASLIPQLLQRPHIRCTETWPHFQTFSTFCLDSKTIRHGTLGINLEESITTDNGAVYLVILEERKLFSGISFTSCTSHIQNWHSICSICKNMMQ